VHISDKWIFTKKNLSCVPTLQSVALAILELLATNAPNNLGSRDLGYAPFSKICNALCLDCHWERAGQKTKFIALMQLTECAIIYVGSNWPRLPNGVIKLGFPSKG